MKNPKIISQTIENINKAIDKYKALPVLCTISVIAIVIFIFTQIFNVKIIETKGQLVKNTLNIQKSYESVSQPQTGITIPSLSKKTTNKSTSLVNNNNKQSKFIADLSDLAVKEAKQYGIPASIKIAQAALESGWGCDKIVKTCNNYYGLKIKSDFNIQEKKLVLGSVNHKTREYKNDRYLAQYDRFCKYKSRWYSFRHHTIFLLKRMNEKYNKGYASMKSLDRKDYKSWARSLQDAGYSTDPNYASKLIEIIQKYKLYQLD